MKEDKPVLLQIHNNIATITLNRSHVLNAFDDVSIQLLSQHLRQIQEDDAIRAVILRGNGKHFCAGADIAWMQRTIHYSKSENEQDAFEFAKLLNTFYHLNKPTITVVQGSVFGGAIGLVACSDITIATIDATFCFSEAKLGLVPAIISPYVIRALGTRKAMYYMLTAETFLAKKALALGLINEVVKQENVETELKKVLTLLQGNGKIAMQTIKKLVHQLDDSLVLEEQMEYTVDLIANIRVSQEAQERLTDFLVKKASANKASKKRV